MKLPVFVYDGACGFCTRWATWLSRRADPAVRFEPFEALPPDDRHDIGAADIRRASFFVDEHGKRHRGSDGFIEVFRRSRGPLRLLGLGAALPGPRQLCRVVYRLVARNRHRLPAPR